MSFRCVALLVLAASLVAPDALAQSEDDLLGPLTPTPQASPPKPKPGKRRVKKPSPVKKPPTEGQTEEDLIAPLAPKKTELLVKLSGGIKGARLFVDGKEIGALPTSILPVIPGEHTVVVRRPGYAEFSRRVMAPEGKLTEVIVVLEAEAGVVAVNVDVAGAQVSVDGQPLGQAPLQGVLLQPGPHDILVLREGFEPENTRILVRAGKDYTVNVHLRPAEGGKAPVARADSPKLPLLSPAEPAASLPGLSLTPEREPVVSTGTPWFKRWYVWAGVGAVAAAAVGTVVMLQNDSVKSLSEEDVCGGQCDGSINAPGIVRF